MPIMGCQPTKLTTESGAQAIDATVVVHLFDSRPCVCRKQSKTKFNLALSALQLDSGDALTDVCARRLQPGSGGFSS